MARPASEKNACALGGTKYCRLLNMRSCESCTVRGVESTEQVRSDLDLYESLLPEGGVARLFQAQDCQFCREEPKGRRHGYAILDMAHPEPRRLQKRLIGKRETAFGTMIPLQFAVCPACRRRFLWIEYAALVFPLIFGAAGLGLLAVEPLRDALADWTPIAPFLLWLAMLAVGILVGTLVSGCAKKRYNRVMITDVFEHPVVREMAERGWTPVAKQSRSKLLFSKSRLARGLGTAADEKSED
ncbi:MAG: hypothetical protein Q4C13_07830 [Clostridia bacterium]|nr:hypothetical protein [Clostridia bacterium]